MGWMPMNTIEIPLDIPAIETESIVTNEEGEIIITVRSTVDGTYCRKCGRKINKLHGHDKAIVLRHLSILGRNTYICICPARYRCTHCEGKPTTTQKLQWYEERSSCTKEYEEHILLQLVNSTVSDVSIKEDIGYETVMGIIGRRIDTEVNWEEIESLNVIGIDEISLKKGHKDFVTIVTARDGDKITIIAVLNDRKKSTVKAFLSSIPKRLRKTVIAVCSDMYDGYINAAKEVFGEDTKIVVDRFHIAKLYRKAVDDLRKKEMRRLKKELSEEEYRKLRGVMWILRKDAKELAEEELEVLKLLFKYSLILKIAYKLCNDLTAIFDADISKSEAQLKINDWKNEVIKSGLTCFNKFLSTLDKWMCEIANYFINRQTSGFVEGLNNKIKVIKRRCYGIFNVGHIFQRIHLDLEGYSLFA
jgi:transposase